MSVIHVPILRDSGKRAYAYRLNNDGELRRRPLSWPCPDERSARIMAAIFAGDYSASPRSVPRRPATAAVIQDGFTALGMPASVPVREKRRVSPVSERTAIKKARQIRKVTAWRSLFDMAVAN